VRILIGGSSGSGKSTLAKALAGRLGCPQIELDALNWDPGWKNLAHEDLQEFRRRVRNAVSAEAWTCDGNYSAVRPVILERATHLVWLNYPRHVIIPRVIWRSMKRVLDRRELWAGTGNRERLSTWLSKEHPIRWSWDTYGKVQATYQALFDDPALAHIERIRLRHPREATALVHRLTAPSPVAGEAGRREPVG
jgi:adenylate kinase family enzyme